MAITRLINGRPQDLQEAHDHITSTLRRTLEDGEFQTLNIRTKNERIIVIIRTNKNNTLRYEMTSPSETDELIAAIKEDIKNH